MPRVTAPLTDTFVRQIKHSGEPGDDKHRDGGGLYLQVTPTGGSTGTWTTATQESVKPWLSGCTPP